MISARLQIRKKTLVALLGLFICLCLAAFNLIRTPTWSTDIFEYQISYELINETKFRDLADFIQLSFEPAFIFTSIATGYFTKSVNFVLFLFALVSLVIKLVYIPSFYVKNKMVFILAYILTYYFLLELTQNRIAIATSILLLGYHFLATKRRMLFVGAVIFASLFHYTAVIALLALLFDGRNGRHTIRRHAVLLFILIISYLALKSSTIFSVIESLDPKKASYIYSTDNDLGSGLVRITSVLIYQVLILLSCRPSLIKLAPPMVAAFHNIIFNLYAASISIYFALNSFGVVAVRLAEVFRNLEPLLLIITLSYCCKEKKLLLVVVILISIFVNLQKNSNLYSGLFSY